MTNTLEPALVLHSRPYQDSSALVELFCQQAGRLTAIAKGVRRPKSRRRALLQPFTPLLVKLTGKSDLKVIAQVEPSNPPLLLTGNALYSGFYLNELLVRLLPKFDAYPQLFIRYQQTLARLEKNQIIHFALRQFEFILLQQLGYGLSFDVDCQGQGIQPQAYYQFVGEIGWQLVDHNAAKDSVFNVFSGQLISSMGHYLIGEQPQAALDLPVKRLMRLALKPYLGEKALASKQFFPPTEGKTLPVGGHPLQGRQSLPGARLTDNPIKNEQGFLTPIEG